MVMAVNVRMRIGMIFVVMLLIILIIVMIG